MLHRFLCGISNHLHPNWVFTTAACGYWAVLLSRLRESVARKAKQSIWAVPAGIDGYLLYDVGCLNDLIARRDGKTHSGTHRSQLLYQRN